MVNGLTHLLNDGRNLFAFLGHIAIVFDDLVQRRGCASLSPFAFEFDGTGRIFCA